MKLIIILTLFLTVLWGFWWYLLEPLDRVYIKGWIAKVWYIPVVIFCALFFIAFLLSLFEIKIF